MRASRKIVILLLLLLLLGGGIWLFRPGTSAEWAAWVQALGVVTAMVWAVRLQHQVAHVGHRQAAQVAAMFAGNMHWAFRELSDACGKKSWADYVVHRRLLEEILMQGREITLQLLDGRSLAMVSSLRAIAVEALELTVDHGSDGNWLRLQGYFERRLPSIAAWLSATGNPPESSGPTDYAGLRTSFNQLGSRG